MDVMRAECVWVGGSCYRLPPQSYGGDYDNGDDVIKNGDAEDLYEEKEDDRSRRTTTTTENEDEKDKLKYSLEYLSQNRYKGILKIPSAFYGSIIGKKGAVKNRIQTELNVKLTIPKPGDSEGGEIVVHGSSKPSVLAGCRRIDAIAASVRNKMDFTHFLSIPLNSSVLRDNFQKFQDQILNHDSNFDPKFFQSTNLLHCTIGTLTLLDAEERVRASALLEESKDRIIRPILGVDDSFTVNVSGLEIMNDDPEAIEVIFAKINSEKLQIIADEIVELFISSGLMFRQYDKVKLHMTVINTLFGMSEEEEEVERPTINAISILDNFSDFEFDLNFKVQEIHLSQRRAGKRSKENYYFPTSVVKIHSSCG